MAALFEPVLEMKQKLPTLKELTGAVAAPGEAPEPERIEIAARAEDQPARAAREKPKRSVGRTAASSRSRRKV